MKFKNPELSMIILAIVLLIIGSSSCKMKKPVSSESGKEIVLRLEPGEGNPRNSEGDFIQLKNGEILFIYSHFTSGSGDHASAFLASRYSSDNGITWSENDAPVLQNEGGMNIMSVSLLRLNTGEIALFYLRKNSETDCIPYMRTSSDEAKTWSEPIKCISGEGYFVVNNDRFVQLKTGRIIFPAAQHASPDWANGKVLCSYSDDNGKSWAQSELVSNTNNIVLQEPGIVELKDGQLMMFCRTDAGVQYFSYSRNMGENWTPIEPGNIKSPLSPASIERIPETGDLLLLWNNNFQSGRDGGKRTPYNLAISKDEGKTWEKIKTVESDPEGWYCYTAIEFTDKHVLLGHCAGDRRTNNGLSTTQITRLSLDWIYSEATSNPVVSESNGLVTLSCEDNNAEIYYTLDGTISTPENSTLYKEPIVISKISNLYMQAFSPGKTASGIVFTQIGTGIFQPAQQLSAKTEPGLIYNYYECEINNTSEIQKFQPVETGIISEFSTAKSRRDSSFAFTFTGFVKIPEDGVYTFYLESNDGSTMFLNDEKLIDNDGAHGTFELSTSTSLRAGYHKIEINYFQLGGGKDFKVNWVGPGFEKQEISEAVLSHKK